MIGSKFMMRRMFSTASFKGPSSSPWNYHAVPTR